MIFWNGEKGKAAFLIQLAYADNVCFKINKGKIKKKSIVSIGTSAGGYKVTKHVCTVVDDIISVYLIAHKENGLKKFIFLKEYKIYKDNEEIPDDVESVVVQTDNLDKIRKLVEDGRKVSWYEPKLSRFYKYLAQFNFEHLFINLFNESLVLDICGSSKPLKDEFGKNNFILNNGVFKQYISVKNEQTIGYRARDLRVRSNRTYLSKMQYYRWLKGGEDNRSKKGRLRGVYFLWYHNFLVFNYFICRKSIATIVQKNAKTE